MIARRPQTAFAQRPQHIGAFARGRPLLRPVPTSRLVDIADIAALYADDEIDNVALRAHVVPPPPDTVPQPPPDIAPAPPPDVIPNPQPAEVPPPLPPSSPEIPDEIEPPVRPL